MRLQIFGQGNSNAAPSRYPKTRSNVVGFSVSLNKLLIRMTLAILVGFFDKVFGLLSKLMIKRVQTHDFSFSDRTP